MQRSLVGYRPQDCKESDTTEHTCKTDIAFNATRGLLCFCLVSLNSASKYRGPCSDLPQTVKRPLCIAAHLDHEGNLQNTDAQVQPVGSYIRRAAGVSSNLFQWFYAPWELRTTVCWGNLALAEGGRWDPGCSCEGWEDLWGFWDNWPSVPWTECERRRWKHATEAWVFFYFLQIEVWLTYSSFRCTTKWFDICIHCEMIITISLVNIYHCTEFQNIFFLAMRTFKIYSFSNFKVCNTILQLSSPNMSFTLSCLVMSDSLWPMDCSTPGSSVHGISQARILESVAVSFSRGSSWPRDRTCVSYIGR